jgi:hypothetical protein
MNVYIFPQTSDDKIRYIGSFQRSVELHYSTALCAYVHKTLISCSRA